MSKTIPTQEKKMIIVKNDAAFSYLKKLLSYRIKTLTL